MTELRDWLGAKLGSAANHVLLIQHEHTAFIESEDCGVVNDLNADQGYLSVKVYSRRPPSPLWSIHAGEALYQFRSTLDHMTCVLAEERGKGAEDTTEFPIFLKRKDFRNADGTLTKGARRRMLGISLEDQAAIEREQPFNRTDGTPETDPLWLLYLLSNYDRHQRVHLVNLATSTGHDDFTPGWFSRYVTQVSSNFGPFEGDAEVARYTISYDGPPVSVEVKSHVTFQIAFGQPGPAAGLFVIPTLRDIGLRVTKIMSTLFGITLPI